MRLLVVLALAAGFLAQGTYEARAEIVYGNMEKAATQMSEKEYSKQQREMEKQKQELLKSNSWQAEIEKRLADPAYALLRAEIAITRRDGGIYVVITDQGEGFEWQNYIKISPERSTHACGRGIAHAATVCFDTLRYDHIGNKAIAFVQEQRPLRW